MTGWGALRRNEKASAFRAAGLLALGMVLFLAVIGPGEARADFTFPTQIPKSSDALSAIIKAVPGLDAAGLKNFKVSGTSATAKLKIKGEGVTVVVFKRTGVSKVLLAIVPDYFRLSTFLPIPSGTPVDGVKFKDMALVIVPKGAAKNGVSIAGLPEAIYHPLSHMGQRVDFKEGLNLFGEADFTSSGAIKKVLSAVGHNRLTLPLNGAFSTDVFKHDLKTASQKLKEELLVGLTLNLPLPGLRIPGMPNIVSVKDAHLAIVGREVKGKRKIFAGVTGSLNVRIGNKDTSFNFGILAGDPGKQWQAEIKAESKDKITLPFFKALEFDDMKFAATKKGGRWAAAVNAKSKLNNKNINVAVSIPASGEKVIDIKTKMTLKDLAGDISLPGLDDVELDEIKIRKTVVNIKTKVKGIQSNLTLFKHGNASKPYLSVMIGTFSPATIIPGAQNTPLKDIEFASLSFLSSPIKTTEAVEDGVHWPSDVGAWLSNGGPKAKIKPGLNIIGRIEVHPTGEVAKLLKKVGINGVSHPLTGNLARPFSEKITLRLQ